MKMIYKTLITTEIIEFHYDTQEEQMEHKEFMKEHDYVGFTSVNRDKHGKYFAAYENKKIIEKQY